MTCNECVELLPMFALGEGPADRRQDLEAHLAACPGCSEQFRRLNEICGVLREDAQSDDLSEFGVWSCVLLALILNSPYMSF